MRAVVAAGALAFAVLEAAAMALYPGGTWWDRSARGVSFWRNFLCDLEWTVALNGEPNVTGARLAEAAMLAMVVGLAAFWWIVPGMFPRHRRTGAAVRALGLASIAGSVAVVLMPSDRFGAVHGVAVLVAGAPGVAAAIVAVVGMLRGDRGQRAPQAGALGAVVLVVAVVDFALFAHGMVRGGPGSPVVPAVQKVALVLLLAWMLVVAARVG
jgi:hypothetical protein